MKKAMSVWSVCGRPKTGEGQLGGFRGSLHLLEITAEYGDAAKAFIETAQRTDQATPPYQDAHIQEAAYVGWVWVPANGPVGEVVG